MNANKVSFGNELEDIMEYNCGLWGKSSHYNFYMKVMYCVFKTLYLKYKWSINKMYFNGIFTLFGYIGWLGLWKNSWHILALPPDPLSDSAYFRCVRSSSFGITSFSLIYQTR